jgi:hypothetical protein
MPPWPHDRLAQYVIVLTIAALVVTGKVALQTDDLRAAIDALELCLGLPLGALALVSGPAAVSRVTRRAAHRMAAQVDARITHHMDRLIETRQAPAAMRLQQGRAADAAPPDEESS